MGDPVTTYRGHSIRWSDNSDEWVCYDLSDKVRSSPKLSLIKAAIDRMYLAERKSSAVTCYELSYSGGQRTESNVVEYLGENREKSWSRPDDVTVTHKIAVVAKRSGSERPSRRETELDKVMAVGLEADAAWAHFQELHRAAEKAKRAADDAHEALPRLALQEISALVDLHNRNLEPTTPRHPGADEGEK